MKTSLITILALCSFSAFAANECSIIKELEDAKHIDIEQIDGDYKNIEFVKTGEKTKIIVSTGGSRDDQEGKMMIQGEYTYTQRTINGESYCVLKQKNKAIGTIFAALKKSNMQEAKFYVGLSTSLSSLDSFVEESNELGQYFILRY